MALLDVAILEHFTIIFSMILVLVIVYGILKVTKTFEQSPVVQFITSFVVALMLMIVPNIAKIISYMIPWFILLFLFLIFLFIAYKLFGATDKELFEVLKSPAGKGIIYVVAIICIIIVISSIASVYGETLLKAGENVTEEEVTKAETGSFKENLAATFFHPKILGLILIFLIAAFTIAFLAAGEK